MLRKKNIKVPGLCYSIGREAFFETSFPFPANVWDARSFALSFPPSQHGRSVVTCCTRVWWCQETSGRRQTANSTTWVKVLRRASPNVTAEATPLTRHTPYTSPKPRLSRGSVANKWVGWTHARYECSTWYVYIENNTLFLKDQCVCVCV